MTDIKIRKAVPEDIPDILKLIIELAVYEKARHEVLSDEQSLHDTLFGPEAKAYALICEVDGEVAGYAVYFFNYSTWLGKNGIYLEDVYVTPHYRGKGAGKALLKHVARIAVDNDCGRFEWSVLDWNTPAREFYESLGAEAQSEWIIYRTSGDRLKQLADNGEQEK